jgi:hypothetical protein
MGCAADGFLEPLRLLNPEEKPPNRPSPKWDRNNGPDDATSKEGPLWFAFRDETSIKFCLNFDDCRRNLSLIQNPMARGYGHRWFTAFKCDYGNGRSRDFILLF